MDAIAERAARDRISFGEALRQYADLGLGARAVKLLGQFNDFLDTAAALAADAPADEVLGHVLEASGYLASLQGSEDPQDQTRLENLSEFVAVAEEFVQASAVIDVPDDEEIDPDDVPDGDAGLDAFLARVALVADADQLPDADDDGSVTLMTLHTAKGLEFDSVFLTGMEDGTFPHMRSLAEPEELSEERRLAYVGITRARQRLHLSRAQTRTVWGAPQHNPPSRFLEEIPDRLIDWKRLGSVTTWDASPRTTPTTSWGSPVLPSREKRAAKTPPELAAGDRVVHTTFGLGTVLATSQGKSGPLADVDFGSEGKKRLDLRIAPLEKL